jgi:hypothetical protein
LSGYGQEQYQQAVRDMAATFGEQKTSVTLGRYLTENASHELRTIRQAPFQERDSGAFISNTKGNPFMRSLGHDDVPLRCPVQIRLCTSPTRRWKPKFKISASRPHHTCH